MLTTIKGYYDHGQIVLEEIPPVKTKTEVMVTFLTQERAENRPSKRKLGGLEGKVIIPDDFNEPLDDLKDYM
ncbi:MAG TPA: hypothetical protein DCO83_07710 [Mucilaginibacter sp.]|jgi:hypothetical protein|nr:hypothetical protein [Mucilaginibacter sp.]